MSFIGENFCSFPNQESFLGIEISWQICQIIWPQDMYALGGTQDINMRNKRMAFLSYLIDQYHPFVDLELQEVPDLFGWKYWSTWCKQFTPLMLAVVVGDLELVVLLVKNGANVTLHHISRNLSALDLALHHLSCHHPRIWEGRLFTTIMPGPRNPLRAAHTTVTEETDRAKYDFFVEQSIQSRDLILLTNPGMNSGGESTRVPIVSIVLTFTSHTSD